MRLFFLFCTEQGGGRKKGTTILLHRVGEAPRLFMHHVDFTINTAHNDKLMSYRATGDFVDGMSFRDLKEDDRLYLVTSSSIGYYSYPFFLDMEVVGDMLLPFTSDANPLAVAGRLGKYPAVSVTTRVSDQVLGRAISLRKKAEELYAAYPAFGRIMLRDGDGVEPVDLLTLASRQEPELHASLEAMFLSMSGVFHTHLSVANRILGHCRFGESFSLLTQEEQVSAFIAFSKQVASTKDEYVPDDMIEAMKSSPEYERTKGVLAANGLGMSETQQFNVLQSVGLFSKNHADNVLYNLSDMGAGKTLMTVESIYMLDLKQIALWAARRAEYTAWEGKIDEVRVPDKHIIAPTLSVKSSWIDTFRMFYDVVEVDEYHYRLVLEYEGIAAVSEIEVAPFTVRDGKLFVKRKLPEATPNTYLIIDEIHQLVFRNVAKSKFFPPKTLPVETYRIFVLSGTMSNMQTVQWFNMIRFLGLRGMMTEKVQEALREVQDLESRYMTAIDESARDVQSGQHRYFDVEPMTSANAYCHERAKEPTSISNAFFSRYGTQILVPYVGDNGTEVKDVLEKKRYRLVNDPAEADSINFELFYKIVGDKAITAQSMEISEELFGEQKKQHASDIIKTVSPLSASDISLLKVLHHIAADYNQYKSPAIAKAINNAILNLNDGLQAKNLYDLVSGFAEKNMRFLEYLSKLDVNVLEKLPASGLIAMPELTDTDKFKVLKDILQREKDETHLIVVNDYMALKALSEALGIEHLSKDDLKRELDYQELLDALFEKQSVVIVTQDMIKSSLDLVQANRLVQYQLNTEISDIIQTQNRINRIGQTRETKSYYIASDQLQETLIELFLESYRNIRVAHRGIVELFVDITTQINVINDYLDRAFLSLDESETDDPAEVREPDAVEPETDLAAKNPLPGRVEVVNEDGICQAVLFPKDGDVLVLVPLVTGTAYPVGTLVSEKAGIVTRPTKVRWDLRTNCLL